MKSGEKFTISVAVNDVHILRKNLLLSPDISKNADGHQLIIKENYPSAALAHNSTIKEAENDVIIFIHQDVYLPKGWFSALKQSISDLEVYGNNWGVLGCFGCREFTTAGVGQVFTTGLGIHGKEINYPEPVETLDEIVLVIRRSSGLQFDPSFPHFHLYGTDICLSAKDKGMMCYAIPAFCVHNTNQILTLPKEYWLCYNYLKNKWRKFLPIHTSCIKISRFDGPRYHRWISEVGRKAMGRIQLPKPRLEDPRTVLPPEKLRAIERQSTHQSSHGETLR